MSKPASGAAVPRRAPRLGSRESIAGHITRRGRFKAIDPRKGRPLPTVSRWFAVLGWALLLEESLRRARAAVRAPEPGTGA